MYQHVIEEQTDKGYGSITLGMAVLCSHAEKTKPGCCNVTDCRPCYKLFVLYILVCVNERAYIFTVHPVVKRLGADACVCFNPGKN